MKMMFPGDHPEIVYPMLEGDYGGAAAIHPLQLHIGRVSLDRAAALVKMWHVSPINDFKLLKFGVSYAAEYNNRFYAVAVWFRAINARLSLQRMAAAPYAPNGTMACMLKISSAMAMDDYPEARQLVSRESLFGDIYLSHGWERKANNKSHKRPAPWVKEIEREEPQPPADNMQPMLTGVLVAD